MALLIIEKAETKALEGSRYEIHEDAIPTLIGRDLSNDVAIEDQRSSRVHARIYLHFGSWYLEDMQSSNGIHFRGRRIQKEELRDGDVFQIGSTRFRFLPSKTLDSFAGKEIQGCRLDRRVGADAGVLRYCGWQLAMDRAVRVDFFDPRRPGLTTGSSNSEAIRQHVESCLEAATRVKHPRLGPLVQGSLSDFEGRGCAVFALPGDCKFDGITEEMLSRDLPVRLRLVFLLAEAMFARARSPRLRSPCGILHVGVTDSLEPWLPALELSSLVADLRRSAPHLPALLPYLPPERFRTGEPAVNEEASTATVIYNLGALGYHILTGRPPLGSDCGEIQRHHGRLVPTPADQLEPRIPAAVSGLLERMLAKSPDARPVSRRKILETLRPFSATEPRRPSGASPAAAANQRRRAQPPRTSAKRGSPRRRRSILLLLPLWVFLWAALFFTARLLTALLLERFYEQ